MSCTRSSIGWFVKRTSPRSFPLRGGSFSGITVLRHLKQIANLPQPRTLTNAARAGPPPSTGSSAGTNRKPAAVGSMVKSIFFGHLYMSRSSKKAGIRRQCASPYYRPVPEAWHLLSSPFLHPLSVSPFFPDTSIFFKPDFEDCR